MSVDEILTLVSTCGFPIVMSGALLWMMYQNNIRFDSELEKLRDVVNNNTQVLNQVLEVMRGLTNGKKE